MYKSLLSTLFLMLVLGFAACCPEPEVMTDDQIEAEKQQVVNVIKAYNKAMEEENFHDLVETLGNEVIFFGTDSSEIINTFSEFKKKIKEQWDYYQGTKYGEMTNVSIQMDKNATIASVIFGMPVDLTVNGQSEHLYLRVSRTLKKEQEKWVIVSGIVGAARPDVSTQSQSVEGMPADTMN